MWLTPMSDEEQAKCARNAVQFQHYIREKMQQCRLDPRDDLMTELVRAADTGESNFTDDELILMFTLSLIGAGHGTTMAQITSMMYQLLRDPERWQYVLDNPQDIPEIVEEVIRFDPAALGWYRFVTKDVSIQGKLLKKGDMLFMALGSGNHDEKKFTDPESFCPVREHRVKPLTFTQGIHFCPGADLARMELRIALEQLSKRLPDIRITPGQDIEYFPSLPTRGINRLELEWGKV
jgi:cytochrome P450